MPVEYDLIVIGSTPEGIFAALTAAKLNARVALVEQSFPNSLNGFEAIYSRSLSHATHLLGELGLYLAKASLPTEIKLSEVQSRTTEVITTLKEQNSLAILAELGVNVISAAGEFCLRPYQAFVVNKKRLRSRAYIIATGSHPAIPELEELQKISYLTPYDLWQHDKLASLPQTLGIVGENPIGIELAQSLRRLGKKIFLIQDSDRLLPKEDSEASRLIQAKLEAEGIKVFTSSPLTQVKSIDGKKWLQAGDRAIAVDEIIWAGRLQPNIQGLNLEGVGVKYDRWNIQLNDKLQTTNPRIYVCGNNLDSYQLPHIAQYEVSIALKNALFFSRHKVDYASIPWIIFTTPQLARIGITEAQARRRYGKDIEVVKQYFKTIAQSQILGETIGFCKLVVRRNGKILGAQIVGVEAGELIGAIALAMKNKIKLGQINNLLNPSPTLSEIINKIVLEWQNQKLKQNKTLRHLLESWFEWRRNWFS